jgi:hypothetical protein
MLLFACVCVPSEGTLHLRIEDRKVWCIVTPNCFQHGIHSYGYSYGYGYSDGYGYSYDYGYGHGYGHGIILYEVLATECMFHKCGGGKKVRRESLSLPQSGFLTAKHALSQPCCKSQEQCARSKMK